MIALALILAAAADALPDPDSYRAIGWLVVCAGALFVSINQVDDFFGRRKDKPSPADVERDSAKNFATKLELEQLREDFAKSATNLANTERLLREEFRNDVADLHEKLNQIGREASALTASTNLLNQTMSAIGHKLDRVIERGPHHE